MHLHFAYSNIHRRTTAIPTAEFDGDGYNQTNIKCQRWTAITTVESGCMLEL